MPYNQDGKFRIQISFSQDKEQRIPIESERFDANFDDVANGLSSAFTKEYADKIAKDLDLSENYKVINSKDGDTASPGAIPTMGQILSGNLGFFADISEVANTVKITSPAIAEAKTGCKIITKLKNACGYGQVKIELNGRMYPLLKMDGTDAFDASEIRRDEMLEMIYDGSAFQLKSPTLGRNAPLMPLFSTILTTCPMAAEDPASDIWKASASGFDGRIYTNAYNFLKNKYEASGEFVYDVYTDASNNYMFDCRKTEDNIFFFNNEELQDIIELTGMCPGFKMNSADDTDIILPKIDNLFLKATCMEKNQQVNQIRLNALPLIKGSVRLTANNSLTDDAFDVIEFENSYDSCLNLIKENDLTAKTIAYIQTQRSGDVSKFSKGLGFDMSGRFPTNQNFATDKYPYGYVEPGSVAQYLYYYVGSPNNF
jgi:hypothetical protein